VKRASDEEFANSFGDDEMPSAGGIVPALRRRHAKTFERIREIWGPDSTVEKTFSAILRPMFFSQTFVSSDVSKPFPDLENPALTQDLLWLSMGSVRPLMVKVRRTSTGEILSIEDAIQAPKDHLPDLVPFFQWRADWNGD